MARRRPNLQVGSRAPINPIMSPATRSFTAIVLMTVGLIALIVSGVSAGWNALDAIGVVSLGVAIGAQYPGLRRARAHN
jgi:hypothetical protein